MSPTAVIVSDPAAVEVLRDILRTHEETPQTQWIVDRIRREFPLLAASVDREQAEATTEESP